MISVNEHFQHGLSVDSISTTIKRRKIVNDVSLLVGRGEIVGLLGPNGAGKTTCFYLIAGIFITETGSIHLDGQDVTHLPLYRRAQLGMGYLPQEISIFRGLTVEENILAVLEIREPNPGKRYQTLDLLLREFSIEHIRKSPSHTLSGGERRRVEFARCLACKPSYVLLDEPFAGLDPIIVGSMRKLVWHLKSRNIGILVTDHNANEILDLVDKVYVMFDGKILTHGTPEQVKNNEHVREIYLGPTFLE